MKKKTNLIKLKHKTEIFIISHDFWLIKFIEKEKENCNVNHKAHTL